MSHAKVSSNSFSPVTFSYTYDKLGNILTAARTGYGTTTYTYDQQGQLLSEANTNYGSGTYEYDTFGNLRSKCFGQGEQYTYKYTDGQWRDLLTEVTYTTPAGTTTQTLVYDGCGNPLQYFNGRTYTMTWVNGRELNTAAVGGKTYSYEYDVNSLRTDKTVNGVTHHYTYAGGKLLREAYGNTTLDFLYDANGYPYILNHTVNGVTTTYYYITNPQGDVIRIVNTSGATVVNYYYDAWGQLRHSTDTSSNSIGTLNPLRYRGYYFDEETGFYYLQSRYYDPTLGRFINADGIASTGQGFLGYNMFAYCGNNPINYADPSGCIPDLFNNRYNTSDSSLAGGGGGSATFSLPPFGGIAAAILVAAKTACDAISDTAETVGDAIVDGAQWLFDELMDLVTAPSFPIYKMFSKELAKDYQEPFVVHHIVAKGDNRAARSQEILRNAGFSVEKSGLNLICIPERIHRHIHTASYHKHVTSVLESTDGSWLGVTMALIYLREEITIYCETGVKSW